MTPRREGAPWRLIVGTIAFAAWASPSPVGLPLAALSLLAQPRTARGWGVALAAGGPSLAELLLPASDALPEFVRAYTLPVPAGLGLLAPLHPALGAFREFRFGDYWVWAVVASLAVWVAPVLAGLKVTALNLLVMLGALYLLRGAAIVLAFSGALGITPAALAIGAAVSTLLIVPLLLLVPALTTLGVTDTWLEFRRRLKAPA